ncbi:DUF1800 domain-containing protein [Salmonirosea aquatica]|uniref:DUF1800 family protein n=1 Tax=Salmonirosea aquatica TaxID=2654236 RepID=A0A7C9BET9_9BACT|nr:DUF1800 family protein [Cytophagaceae bacterium SJW1-29]
MKESFFLSQRLGFTNAQAAPIGRVGIRKFLTLSLASSPTMPEPALLQGSPRTREELRNIRQMDQPDKAKFAVTERRRAVGLAHLWLEKMHTDEFPLREKMVLFWHNHFVSDIQKVKVSYAMWRQNALFREMAFGNYRELTRRILYDNAMLAYLDNTQNKANKLNENLSRELLELFTLGVGNYTETDIKEGARALAGLNLGDAGGQYYNFWEDKGTKTYLGKTGNWKADDMVDLIFDHPKAGELLMTKFLKFFVTDSPSATLVADYTTAFRKADFEMTPMLEKLVDDSRFTQSQGMKIKDPVTYLLQLLYEFQQEVPPALFTQYYCNEQGMKLLNPPNVKGWDGGRSWLSSQKLLQRVGIVSQLAGGKSLGNPKAGRQMQSMPEEMKTMMDPENEPRTKPALRWDQTLTKNKAIIQELTDRNLFAVSPDLQNDCEQLLKYDFDAKSSTANLSVTRLAEHIMKSPEFQIY